MATGKEKENRFTVYYSFAAEDEKQAREKAFDICVEQTIEFPYSQVTQQFIKETVTGRVHSIKKKTLHRYEAEISYADETAGGELTQLLNVIFGNISLKPGIRVERLHLSDTLLSFFQGPAFGVEGVRKLLQAFGRPLIASVLKPMGLNSRELAALARTFALGGIDIIKDDHSLTNQRFAPFEERVARCAEAVRQVNEKTGMRSLYAPTITADGEILLKRAAYAQQAGAGGLVVCPGLTGFSIVKECVENPAINLPLLFHPAFLGSYTVNRTSGISPYVLYGQLSRLIGADMVLFPHFHGRFSYPREVCRCISTACSDPLGIFRTVFPVPGGGVRLAHISQMKQFYGTDVVFLISGGLFSGKNTLIDACKAFKASVLASDP